MYKKVLLAADGSENSVRAAEHAMAMVEHEQDSHMDIIFAVDGDKSKSDVLKYGDSNVINSKRKAKLAPIETKLKEKNISYDIHIKHGDPGPAIVKFANEGSYQCVIIGSRGLNQVQTMVLGSVSHKVAKRVQCPVMIVK
ncbi:universal stress protein [Sinobaca sp. H24]|uniref:universal stress protein n=1 Tax=Sinobaca sp. H24 TaxID=2923376 RepID=UPI00207988DA|nr:universal stress protein [Sinobaca sp. H24]